MSDFKVKMDQNWFRLGGGNLQRSPDPLAEQRGRTSKGSEWVQAGEKRRGRENKGREWKGSEGVPNVYL